MKRYNLIIAVVLALALMVSGAEAKKFAKAHEQLQNVSIHGLSTKEMSSKIRSMIADISFAISKFKKELLSEEVAPGLDGDKGWPNDVPVNDVPPYYDPDVSGKNNTMGPQGDGGKKPIRWFMQYKAVDDND
jgi:hypothetical protein